MENTNTWYRDHVVNEMSELRSLAYLFTSSILHAGLFTLALFIGSMIPKPELPPLTEITILDSAPGAALASTSVVSPQVTEPATNSKSKEDVIIRKVKPVKIHTKKIAIAKSSPVAHPKFKISRALPTVTQSEVIAPALDTNEIEQELKSDIHVKAQKFDDRFLKDDLEKIDQESSTKVAALKQEFESQSAEALSEQDETFKSLQSEQENQKRALTQQAAQMKAADQARIQSAVNAERAALAREQATKAAQGSGINGPIRSLQDLRQIPGNKRPTYDALDRLAGKQGDISFVAYVGKDGRVTQFKLIKGTGHRSLDLKTLQAIREWKFYPGQEGWVEIPFRWDLKGGPQELPATLRRNISQK